MKIHRPIVLAIFSALQEVFFADRYADKVIEFQIKKNRRWGARDRRFFAEAVYDQVRWWRRLWFAIDQPATEDPQELWKILVLWSFLRKGASVELEDFANHRQELAAWAARWERADGAIAESFPDWLYDFASEQMGASWPQVASSLNRPAEVFLRANTLKTSVEDLQRRLAAEGILTQRVDDVSSALQLTERRPVFRSQAFREGLFEMQDAASQLVAPLLEVQAGHRVVDACAGAGGKSLHLAALMQNKGRVIAMDIHQWKLDELKKRARRAGVSLIETRLIDSSKVTKRLKESADRVLIDSPCSGVGVIRRNPDTKWKLKREEVQRLVAQQSQLLSRYSTMCRRGGKLVYATCSILPCENREIVEGFLKETSEFQLSHEMNISPLEGFDGFYAAVLTRTS